MRNVKFENFMAQLEGAVATESERSVIRKALEGYHALNEAFLDRTVANYGSSSALGQNTYGQHGTQHSNAPGQATAQKQASANAPSQADLNTASQTIMNWVKAEPEKAQRWVQRIETLINNTAMQKYSFADDPKKAFDDAVSGKTDEDVKKIGDNLKQDQDAEAKKQADAEAKAKAKQDAEAKKQAAAEEKKAGYAAKYNELKSKQDQMDKDNEMVANTYGKGTYADQKLSLKDRLKMKWNKWRAGIKEAIERGDMAMLESIEAEMRAAKAFMESLGYDVSSIMY